MTRIETLICCLNNARRCSRLDYDSLVVEGPTHLLERPSQYTTAAIAENRAMEPWLGMQLVDSLDIDVFELHELVGGWISSDRYAT